MKSIIRTLLAIAVIGLASCNRTEQTVDDTKSKSQSAIEELRLAGRILVQAGELKDAGQKEKSLKVYEQAIYHLANVVVRDDANDTLRAAALENLRWIEAHQKHNYGVALQYLNQCIKLRTEDHPHYVLNLADKADDLWHIEERDSAIYYAKLALRLPHHHPSVDYICSHVLWQVYKELGVRDSAEHYRQFFVKVRDGKLYEEQTMDELKAELKDNVLAHGKPVVKEELRPSEIQKKDSRFKEQKQRQSIRRLAFLLLTLSSFIFLHHYRKHYRRRHLVREEPQSPSAECQPACSEFIAEATEEERGETFALPEALILRRSLADGKRAFEGTASYDDLNTMQIKEKELYDMAFEATRDVESTLFASFKEACAALQEGIDLNDQELVCCFCAYLGYSNNVIAYIGHTTPAAIRKRKERIKKKLPADFCDIIFGSKG